MGCGHKSMVKRKLQLTEGRGYRLWAIIGVILAETDATKSKWLEITSEVTGFNNRLI